ncbi:Uncharacterised protein [uncultured archaeon]|nr:Uncharacterised protein [uncultured archaeon]
MATVIRNLKEIRKIEAGRFVVFNHKILGLNSNDFYNTGIVIPDNLSEIKMNKLGDELIDSINEIYSSEFMNQIREECERKYPRYIGWDYMCQEIDEITGLAYNLPQGTAIVSAPLPLPEDKRVIELAKRYTSEVEKIFKKSLLTQLSV